MMPACRDRTALSKVGDQQKASAHRDQVLEEGQQEIWDGQAESAAVGITGESANDPAQST